MVVYVKYKNTTDNLCVEWNFHIALQLMNCYQYGKIPVFVWAKIMILKFWKGKEQNVDHKSFWKLSH